MDRNVAVIERYRFDILFLVAFEMSSTIPPFVCMMKRLIEVCRDFIDYDIKRNYRGNATEDKIKIKSMTKFSKKCLPAG
ncbi:hypothetical protein D3C78_1826890 [compost metagenome]